jgi:hypothetical protein
VRILPGESDLESYWERGLRERFARKTGVATETVLDLRAGQASFHHSLTIHGSWCSLNEP